MERDWGPHMGLARVIIRKRAAETRPERGAALMRQWGPIKEKSTNLWAGRIRLKNFTGNGFGAISRIPSSPQPFSGKKKGACALRRAEREAETFVSRLDRNNVFIQNDSIQSASIHFIDFSFWIFLDLWYSSQRPS